MSISPRNFRYPTGNANLCRGWHMGLEAKALPADDAPLLPVFNPHSVIIDLRGLLNSTAGLSVVKYIDTNQARTVQAQEL